MELLVAMKAFGAGYSTLTLKTLALVNSTLALALWIALVLAIDMRVAIAVIRASWARRASL